jgi:signal peptidase I
MGARKSGRSHALEARSKRRWFVAESRGMAPARSRRTAGSVLAAILVIAFAIVSNPVVLVPLLSEFAIGSIGKTSGPSMEPTLTGTDIGWADVLTYRLREPERGDIVVIDFSEDFALVKRIVGLPGEVIAIEGDQVFINGEPLDEPYVGYQWSDHLDARRIPDDGYFVMGDNRENSSDSRDPRVGVVPRDAILGLYGSGMTPGMAFSAGLIAMLAGVAVLWILLLVWRRGRSPWWASLALIGFGVGVALVHFFVRAERPRPAFATPQPWPPVPSVAASGLDALQSAGATLRRLRELHEEGLITAEEFDERRRRVLETF